jgi:hypothetical protein
VTLKAESKIQKNMTTNSNNSSADVARQKAIEAKASMDRLIRWCVVIFGLSSVGLSLIAYYAAKTGSFDIYMKLAGVIYLVLSTGFLAVISFAFVQGHLGTSREIEAPKLDLFEIEKLR